MLLMRVTGADPASFVYKNNIRVVYMHRRQTVNSVLKYLVKKGD
jgi:hypothetical protein